MIPQSFIDDLLYRADIAEVVGQYVQLKSAGANLQGLCPFHNEKSPSFSVSPIKQFYHCFGCGAHGNAISFLMNHLGLTFPEAVETLAARMGLDVPHEKGVEQAPELHSERESQVGTMTTASGFYKKQLKRAPHAVDYLQRRGLTGEVAARFGLGYAPAGYQPLAEVFGDYASNTQLDAVGLTKQSEQGRRYDRFRDRIMFPIRNPKGQVIAFGGRILEQGEPKYLNSPETALFSKGTEVYGLFEGRQAIHAKGYVLVTEGYMDVVALAQWGYENAVATLGTAVTETHVQKLFKHTGRLVFAFDGDSAGRKAAWRALEASLPYVTPAKGAYFVFLPPEHDPDSYIRNEGPEAFEYLINKAESLADFLIRHLKENFQLEQVEGSSSAIAFLKPRIQTMAATELRLMLLQALARQLDMQTVVLERMLGLSVKRSGADVGAFQGAGYGRSGQSRVLRSQGQRQESARQRPAARTHLFNLAVRLVRVPSAVACCDPLLRLLELRPDSHPEVLSFLHLVEKLRSAPNVSLGGMMHAFRDGVHQEWVNAVLQRAAAADETLDFETELSDSVYQCLMTWFEQETARLAAMPQLSEADLTWYQSCLEQIQALRQTKR
ncbi:MAG: DNA primase [Limnobacter sp.]|nr:DNA primase [Limnobacter sp.]